MTKTVEIEPVQRAQLTEQVIEHIKEYIEANDLHPGAKLPGERDLAKALGVSRNVTREAVRALQATGILEIQPGNGIFVAEFGFEALANHFSFVVRSQQHQLSHLIEARIFFEVGILELAANRITPHDIELLEKAAHRIARAKTSEEDVAAEIEFHSALVDITGNPVLMEFASFFNRFFQEASQLAGMPSGKPGKQHADGQEHMEIVRALKEKDIPRAKEILESGIRRWRQ